MLNLENTDLARLKPTTIVVSPDVFRELSDAIERDDHPSDKLEQLFARPTVFDKPFTLND